MVAMDAARNLFLQTGQDGARVANIVCRWLLCGFDPNDERTDILTHIQLASDPSLDSGATGLKKLNAICQALNKLSGDVADLDEIAAQGLDRERFIGHLEQHLNKQLWAVMLQLVDAEGQALEMPAWEQRLAEWLAAYQFVRRHFPRNDS